MTSSGGSIETSTDSYPNFSFSTSQFMTTSFSDLLAGNDYTTTTDNNYHNNKERITVSHGFSDRIADRTGSGVPKFKSIPPPSLLPISPPPASPSSYFSIPPGLSPAELLDSPVLLSTSNILPSPTTGSFPAHPSFNWRGNSGNFQQNVKQENRNYSDFSFQPQTRPLSNFHSSTTTISTQQPWTSQEPPTKQSTDFSSAGRNNSIVKSEFPQSFSPEISSIQTHNNNNNNSMSNGGQSDYNNNNVPPYNSINQTLREKRRSEDGYNWRKYGQKQVKGSENPRSYYKCTYPNCPTKKKVERSLDGQITEIVYKGSHNHPKPQSTRRSSSSSASSSHHQAITAAAPTSSDVSDQFISSTTHGGTTVQMELVTTPDNSSISIGDEDFDQSSQRTKSGGGDDQIDEDEPDAKRWKKEMSENHEEGISASGSRTVREPRVVVQTTSDIDILDDGYRWRKYGQKVVKGNPNPRSYYKCTSAGCTVRKHVERASHDLRAVITTYEGKHNHDVPAARGSGNINRPIPTTIPAAHDNNNSNHGGAAMSSHVRPPYSSSSVVTSGRDHQQQYSNINNNHVSRSMPISDQEQTPFTLEMLKSPGSFGFSGFNNSSAVSSSSYMNQQHHHSDGVFSKTKEEPRDNNDMFLESLLY